MRAGKGTSPGPHEIHLGANHRLPGLPAVAATDEADVILAINQLDTLARSAGAVVAAQRPDGDGTSALGKRLATPPSPPPRGPPSVPTPGKGAAGSVPPQLVKPRPGVRVLNAALTPIPVHLPDSSSTPIAPACSTPQLQQRKTDPSMKHLRPSLPRATWFSSAPSIWWTTGATSRSRRSCCFPWELAPCRPTTMPST